MPSADDKWINYPEQDVKGSTTSLPNIKIDLKKGLVSKMSMCLSKVMFVRRHRPVSHFDSKMAVLGTAYTILHFV